MKRHILSILILIAVALVAPSRSAAQFRYGPMLGFGLTDLSFKQPLITVDRTAGFSTGVATELMFPGIGFGINSGVFYEMKGARLHLGEKYIWSSQGYGTERSYLHYLSVPINLRFKWTRMGGIEDYVAPYIFGGPVFSLLVGNSHIKALQYARGDVGLCAGLGFEVLKRYQIQASYNWGVTYAEKTRLLDDFSARNKALDIRVVYFF